MRFETSLFSLTLYKKHLKRYWPMWAAWLLLWLMALPVTIWNQGQHMARADLLAEVSAELFGYLQVLSTLTACAAPVVAVAVYFYLYKSNAANFAFGLPMRREGLFFTGFAAGFTILFAPILVTVLVTLGVEGMLGVLTPGPLLRWLGGSALLIFFWFSFATFCAVISGNPVASVTFYGIFNGLVWGFTLLLEALLSVFLYGFGVFSDGVKEAVDWLTPIVRLNRLRLPTGQYDWELLWIYAGVGFLILLAAIGLHHIRKAERATDLIAFGPLRYIFKYSVTVCGGLAFGMAFCAIIFSGFNSNMGLKLAVCCGIWAAISYLVAEMLLQKTFRVLKKGWVGAVVSAVCFLVVICGIEMDWIGYTTRVPDAHQVKTAQVTINGDIDPIAGYGLSYSPENIQPVIDLHRYITTHKELNEGDDRGRYLRLEVDYDLGWSSLRRTYTIWADEGCKALVKAALPLGEPMFDIDQGTPTYMTWENGQVSSAIDLESRRRELWAAIQEDVKAGRYRADPNADSAWDDYLNIEWYKNNNKSYTHQNFFLRDTCTATKAALDKWNLTIAFQIETTQGPG